MADRFSKGSSIREVMTRNPTTCTPDSTITDAARAMRDDDIGDVLIVEGDELRGLVTDRDIAVRAVAEGMDTTSTPAIQIATTDLVTLEADATIEDAIRLMKEKDIRRLPVTDGGRPVGVVSLGDLAVARDEDSALADISAASPNN
jgi:CBS domain-containing protein